MFDLTHCSVFMLAVASMGWAQQEPQIISSAETVGVYSGQTAVLKCRIANLGNRTLVWSSRTHDFVIYEGGKLLAQDAAKYSLIYSAGGQVQDLQISNVGKFDNGFYQCAIQGTEQQIFMHLEVVDVPSMILPWSHTRNKTDCCIEEKVSEACLPGCIPGQVDLQVFNATERCGTVADVKGVSKCFTDGSNHDNCCINMMLNPICLGFCHNVIPSVITPEHHEKCYTADAIMMYFLCFEMGFEFLPSEPTDVSAMAFHNGLTGSILMKWAEPRKNPDKVSGYRIQFKPRFQTSYSSVLITDTLARSYLMNGNNINIQSDMDYKVRVSALADHGVSFGSVEVDIYVPTTTLPDMGTSIDICCSNRGVEEKCRNLLCDSKTWSYFNADDILECFPYLTDVFTCLIGERNHTNCCAAFDVTSDCLSLCSGHPPPLNSSLINCVSQMSIVEACVQQGNSTQPTPPTQITIASVETRSAIIKFQPSLSIGLSHYLVGIRKENENADFVYNMRVEVSEKTIHLNSLRPNTYYWVRVISVSTTEGSLPSETVSFLTYPDDYEPSLVPVTNLPHNMTDCCINMGMPEECWRGCEYRADITTYYSNVLFECFNYIGSVLTCGADGRDHSECCRSRDIQPVCIELCAHTNIGPLEEKYYVCIPDTAEAVTCFMEGIVNLPRHPDVVVTNFSKNSISLKWEQPKTSGKIDCFNISYGIAGSEKFKVSTNKTFYILQDLVPSTTYEISVVSINGNGTSAPSSVITQYTLSDYIPTFNKTDVSGRALWQNISHCCENNVPKECLEQCLSKQSAHVQSASCIAESHKMLACFSDGQDHRICCAERKLPSICMPICSGNSLMADVSMATCMSYAHRDIILSCFLEYHDLIPAAPENFGAKLIGTNGSVLLQWSTPVNCNKDCTFTVHFWLVGRESIVSSVDNITQNFMTVEVIPDNVYTFTVIAYNSYGSSSPSPWQTLFIINYERNVNLYLDGSSKWVEQGQPATLICVKDGFDPDVPYKVQWFFNNRRKLENDGMMRLLIPSADPAKDEGDYTCTVTDSIISSSDSILLLVKYAPKFNHFEEENAYPGKGERAKVACLFRGLPDSDEKVWFKDGQLLKHDLNKYKTSSLQSFETGLTKYSLFIADVVETDYGMYSLNVSNTYGRAECQNNLTNPSNISVKPSPDKPDLKQCCAKNDVNKFCQELCGFHVNVTEIVGDSQFLQCLKYIKTFVTCGADGRDHSGCCQKQGVLPMCVPLCSGIVPPNLENSQNFLQCVPDYIAIFSCAQQGHLLLPYAPIDVTLVYKREENSIFVQWKEPHHSGDKVDHYNIYYNYSGSSFPRSVSVNALVMEYYIRNIQPRTVYNVWITAGNQNGNSMATAIIKIDTALDAVSPTSEKQKSSNEAIGVGVAAGVIVLIALLVLVIFFLRRFKFVNKGASKSVTFENPGYGGQVKIQGVEDQYSYGRLREEGVPATHDSSSSAADSNHENPMHKQPTNFPAIATLPDGNFHS